MTDRVGRGPTRAELHSGRRRAPEPRASRGRGNAANVVLAVFAVVLVLVAAGLGVLAFLTYQDAQDTRDGNQPLAARAEKLRSDLSSSDTVIDDLSALFIAIKAQNDATAAAVAATNQAATQYNNAQAGIADALGADAAAAVAALNQATATVKTAVEQATAALVGLGTTDGATGD
jgi:hypothetical protein